MRSDPAETERERRPPEVRVGSTPPGPLAISAASRSLAAGPFHWAAFAAVATLAFAADQALKTLAANSITLGDEIRIAGPFSLTHVRNSGIAFGLFSSWTSAVAALTGIVFAGLLVYFARMGAGHPILPVALGLLAGGSASNLADRVRLGYVIDYVDLQYWPSFNLADTFIAVGVACLLAAYTGAELRHAR